MLIVLVCGALARFLGLVKAVLGFPLLSCSRARTHTHTPYLERERAHTHTHTPYILQKAHTHHIFYRRGDNAQNIPRRTYTPQSSIANAACKVRAPHLPGP